MSSWNFFIVGLQRVLISFHLGLISDPGVYTDGGPHVLGGESLDHAFWVPIRQAVCPLSLSGMMNIYECDMTNACGSQIAPPWHKNMQEFLSTAVQNVITSLMSIKHALIIHILSSFWVALLDKMNNNLCSTTLKHAHKIKLFSTLENLPW